MGFNLTLSGNEQTDATRATGTQGDGLAAESSVGVWGASTNLVLNGGFETNTTNWTAVSSTFTRVTSQFKFGAASGEIVTSNATANEGAYGDLTATAAVHCVSAWVRGAGGGTVRLTMRDNSGLNAQSSSAVTLTTTWQRIVFTTTALANSGSWRLYVETDTQQSITFQVDGAQVELLKYATPYIETNGGTAARTLATVVLPAVSNPLSVTQSWYALRFRYNTTTADGLFHHLLLDGQTGTPRNGSDTYRLDSGGQWRTDFLRNGTATTVDTTVAQARGDIVTYILKWTSTTVAVSHNGGAFSASARGGTVGGAAYPSATNFGGTGSVYPACYDFFWVAGGTGTLSDADAATIHALGNTDPTLAALPGTAAFVWPAVTQAVNTDDPAASADPSTAHLAAVQDYYYS